MQGKVKLMPDLMQRTYIKIFKLTGGFCDPSMLNGLNIEHNSRQETVFLWASHFILYWNRRNNERALSDSGR
jgi:Na+/pantothenate symporter